MPPFSRVCARALARIAGRRKPVALALSECEKGPQLARVLDVKQLVFLGVGAVVGGGIFSSIGEMAAGSNLRPGAGPALVISYVLTAIACGLAALCYAELATMVPVAGSAYTYCYVTLGETVAWIIGWDLVLEYAVGNIYVAQSWADYLRAFLRGVAGVDLPAWMATDVQTAAARVEIAAQAPRFLGHVVAFNLPAFAITALLTLVLVVGVRASARANAALVIGKLVLLGVFIVVGALHVDIAHYTPFAPNGARGVWSAASVAFFSYIGFDALSTTAEEVRTPDRDLPRGMLLTLLVCAVLYVATALVMMGLVPARDLATGDPLAFALRAAGLAPFANVMALGAVFAVTAVLLVFQLGQTRILIAMARDGLLPPAFARIHTRFRTPVFGTVVTGVLIALAPSFIMPAQALDMTSIGTLFAFFVVSIGVIVLRVREPERRRVFRVPGYPVTPLLSAGACLVLMLGLPAATWWRFFVWLLVGMLFYVSYGARYSRLSGRTTGW